MNILKITNEKIFIDDLIYFFLKEKIEIRKVWKPSHHQPFMKKFIKQQIITTDKIYNQCICLPSGFNVTNGNFKKITKAFKKYENMLNHK
jgi:dTDP-4-amino-4,6-dideoxygalactose transaminase